MIRTEITRRIVAAGAIAILRQPDSTAVLRTAEAILRGGVTVIEVTLTTPGALTATEQLVRRLPAHALVGVGSVLKPDDVAQAAESGARFIVSPVVMPETIACSHRYGLPVLPGALTPTEIYRAQLLGADFVKVFPAAFWGPRYIRTLLAPMPHLRLCPTGGVTPANAGQWIQAGASVVGLGSALADPVAVAAGNFGEITHRARTLVQSITEVRT